MVVVGFVFPADTQESRFHLSFSNRGEQTLDTHGYRAWLEQRGLKPASVSTYISDAKRVEDYYGDLDKLYPEDRLAGVLQELLYSADDARRKRPNPSKIPVPNPVNSLASYRATVRKYCEYRETDVARPDPDYVAQDEDDGRARLIGLERDLQAALRDCIEQLEPGLDIVDGGAERSVASGFIDITAKAPDGTVVVIELKAGTARREAIGQVLSYMGDIADKEPAGVRGILVAGEFDDKARAAARVVPSLSLRRYRVKFEFSPPGNTTF